MLSWNLVWWTVTGAFVAPLVPGGWLTLAAAAALTSAPLLVMRRVFDGSLYPSAAVRVGVLRPYLYGLMGIPLLGIAGLLGGIAGLPFGAGRAVGQGAVVAMAGAFTLFVSAGYAGSRRLVVRRYEAAFPDLPAAFDGARVVQLSDLHVGPHTPRAFLRRIVETVQDETPDIVAITGDQVDDHDHDVTHFARAFADVRAPLGVFAVAGNHDVYAGWWGVRRGLEQMGLTVLVNDAVAVERGGERVWIAGTGDPAGRHWKAEGGAEAAPDIARTMARVPAGAFSVVLAHNPALWPKLAERGARLTLSGHTHHGQLSIPALGWCLASPFLEFAMGTHRRGASVLHINPGTNFWGVPLRLGAWPEVTVITLRRGEELWRLVPAKAP